MIKLINFNHPSTIYKTSKNKSVTPWLKYKACSNHLLDNLLPSKMQGMKGKLIKASNISILRIKEIVQIDINMKMEAKIMKTMM
jgi:hypothetical protein